MVKRYPGKDHTSRACEYGNLVYFSAVSAPEQTSLYEQTAAILREYDSMFAELGLKKARLLMHLSCLTHRIRRALYMRGNSGWNPTVSPP